MQEYLFHNEAAPDKIEIFYDFISPSEETELLKHLKNLTWQKVEMHGVVAKRKVVHYGLDYTYTSRSVRPTEAPPDWLQTYIQRISKILKVASSEIKEILITHYPAGAGIGWHKDAPAFGDAIAGISLMSSCTMKFRKISAKGYEIFKMDVPQRSAYVFSGDARRIWQHTIAMHKTERYSITFRTLNSD